MKKKLLFIFVCLFGFFSLASCKEKNPDKDSNEQTSTKYFDVDPVAYDHYFSNQVNLAKTGITVKKDSNGKLEGKFIAEKIAKLTLKSVTDGDTAVFYLNGESDTYTVTGKTYPYVTIRFLGIDTPESTSSIDPWGKAASNYGKKLLKEAAGIIVDASDLENDIAKNYVDRLDSNGTRWLALVWYCPKDKDPEVLENYRSYQLDLIEECYTYATSFSTKRYGYTADYTEEPILYKRYEKVTNKIGEEEQRFGSLTLNELFFEADNRMSRTGTKLRVQGETDPNYDYNTTPVSLSITEAYNQMEKLINAGTHVELKGVITRFISNNFYMEDENGKALYVYMGINGSSIDSEFHVGDTIKIRGRLCEYGGQYQMSGIIFKRGTFVKVEGADAIPMPKPIQMTGKETIDEIKALLGRLVTTTIYCDYIGSASKDGSFSLQNKDVISGLENLTSLIDNSNYYASINHLEVRINGLLAPGYERSSFAKGSSYKVTGIMGIYLEPDYTKEVYPSYQIVVGNRLVNGEVLNEVQKIS